jgi:Flp pilus assembly protein TadG
LFNKQSGQHGKPVSRYQHHFARRVASFFTRGLGALQRDRRGSVGVITAITVFGLCGLIGLGTDASLWYMNGRRIQTIAEVTALSAGRLLSDSTQTTSTITTAAHNDALLNGLTSATDTIAVSFGPSGSTPPSATTITVTVTRNVPLLFSSLFLSSQPLTTAAATASTSGPSVCIYVLGTGSQTLLVNSGFSLSAPNCEVDVASKASPAAIFNSGITFNTQKTCVAGTVTNNGATIGGLSANCATHANPYRGTLAAPAVGGCTVNGANYSGTVSLNPGTYCGNFNFNGSGTVKLASGTYVFNNTNWNINSGWTITGTGVTLYFATSSSYVQFNSGVTVSLTAPTSGTYANVLMFEPDGLSTSSFAIDGASSSGHALQGLVYLPSRNITFNSTYSGTADAFTLVVNQLIFDSNSGKTWSITPASGGGGSGAIVLTN